MFEFQQHVQCPTRVDRTLEHVYNNIKQAYKTTPLPHAGQSDHLSLLFIPVYIFLRNQTPPSTRVIKTWPDDAFLQLRDCFDLSA